MNRKRKSDDRSASFLLTKTTEQLQKAPPGSFPLQSARMREFNILLAKLEATLDPVYMEYASSPQSAEQETTTARMALRRFVRTLK
jgi:hypothetical protein